MSEAHEVRAEEILSALDNEQREVALAVRGPVCVIAGAGTGKTRAITHRIAYASAIGVMNPQKVLALTFTARAAGEMRTRLRALGFPTVAARTIHSAALKAELLTCSLQKQDLLLRQSIVLALLRALQ